MQNTKAHNLLPVAADDKMIEVAIEGDEAVVKLATWTDGLGWSTQKTMVLDETLLEEMSRLLTAARARLKAQRSDEESRHAPVSRVLKFPVLS
ncbi:MAG: hypothetical protein ACK4S4_14265 [Pyrinomonadaceae bacterium]